MRAVATAVAQSVVFLFRSRMALQIEVLALRHQLTVYQRAGRRPQLGAADRLLWAWLSRRWAGWRAALVMVQPRTVIAWQRQRFRDHWMRLSRQRQLGRPPVAQEIRDLIRTISAANPTWGSCGSREFACASPGPHMREVTFFVTTGNGERFKGADGVLARDRGGIATTPGTRKPGAGPAVPPEHAVTALVSSVTV
jgi:hypothetical protein